MGSSKKILFLTLIITLTFLARDTILIDGPLDMSPTITILITSFITSLIIINVTENRKTQNHSKLRLGIVSVCISTFSLFGAFLFNPTRYTEGFLTSFLPNFQEAFSILINFGFLTIVFSLLFGIIVGSDKKLGKTQSYKSSKHKYYRNYR